MCMGETVYKFITRPLSHLIKHYPLETFPLVTQSPMVQQWGITADGKPSERSLTNIGQRKFQVVEFDKDKGTLDQQAAIHWHLARFAPLVLVVFSGSESLHGWYNVVGEAEADVTRFFKYATSLGADTPMASPIQMTRTPNAFRDNGTRQTVNYYNPSLI